MTKILKMGKILLIVVAILGFGYLLVGTDFGSPLRRSLAEASFGGADPDIRAMLFVEHPELLLAFDSAGDNWGEPSRLIAQDIFGKSAAAVADALEKSWSEAVAPGTWLLHLPIVNAVLFETRAGLVLVDTGMPAAGPAVLKLIRELSDKPLHTIIYTHGHVDHAYGAWALLEAGETPQIIAHEALVKRFERYLELRGSYARYMNQPLTSLPAERDDLVWPTRVFTDRLVLEIGGEAFHIVHREAETDDQLYVWVPSRQALASADYYQGFLPNAGNGKRVQRNIEQWILALREMAALQPALLLPAHGKALKEPAAIKENLLVLADALEHITRQVKAGLNAGERKDRIFQSVTLPPRLAQHPTLSEKYVSAKDIARMLIKGYTGWWDDIPSHWSPAPLEAQAAEILSLAGGANELIDRARDLKNAGRLRLASHLADWAWLADADNPAVQKLVTEIYVARVTDPAANTQEKLIYLDILAQARERQLRGKAGP